MNLFLFGFSFILSCHGNTEPHPLRDLLPEDMEPFCPGKEVCLRKSETTSFPLYNDIDDRYRRCCMDCSCDEDCGLSTPCCFPSHAKLTHPARHRQQCIQASSAFESETRIPSYFMVTTSLADSSLEQTKEVQKGVNNSHDKTTPCGDAIVTPWGSTDPVFSNKMGLIYKNRHCAQQDGVEDIIPWDTVVTCKWGFTRGQKITISDISSPLSMLGQSDCYTLFYPPQAVAKYVLKEICFNKVHSTCGNFSLAGTNITMTNQEVINACQSGFYSPFIYGPLGDVYANVFCFICNSVIVFSPGRMVCVNANMFGRDTAASMSLLLKRDYVSNAKIQGLTNNVPERLACGDGTSLDITECRPVLCPIWQSYNHKGVCQFMVTETNLLPMRMYLLVRPLSNVNLRELPMSQPYTTWLRSPWSDWVIETILISNMSSNASDNSDYLFVTMFYPKKVVRPDWLYSEVSRTINEPFSLCYSETKCTLAKQEFAKYNAFHRKGNAFVPLFLDIIQPMLMERLYPFNVSTPILDMFNKIRIPISNGIVSLDLTKHIICPRVELKLDDYEHIAEANIIYLKQQKRFLFDLEYEITASKANRQESVRICLDDSGLNVVTFSASNCCITSTGILIAAVMFTKNIELYLNLY